MTLFWWLLAYTIFVVYVTVEIMKRRERRRNENNFTKLF